MNGQAQLVPTVENFPPDPTVMAPAGAVVRPAARTAVTKALREMRKRMIVSWNLSEKSFEIVQA